jgi:hypothetical protein
MNNIERYFYLIVFAMYVREVGPKDYPQTFKEWMDTHEDLRYGLITARKDICLYLRIRWMFPKLYFVK